VYGDVRMMGNECIPDLTGRNIARHHVMRISPP
jgi:hypothetical protein